MNDEDADVAEIARRLDALPLEEQAQVLQHLLADITKRTTVQPPPLQQPASDQGGRQKFVHHQLEEMTYRINGCAMAVHRRLGPGLRESNYQAALESELQHAGFAYRPQQQIAVYDMLNDRQLLGYYIPDFVVEDAIVVEIKALRGLDNSHIAQVISYLAITGCGVGLLINFGERMVRWRRIFPPAEPQAYLVNKHWLWNPNGPLRTDGC